MSLFSPWDLWLVCFSLCCPTVAQGTEITTSFSGSSPVCSPPSGVCTLLFKQMFCCQSNKLTMITISQSVPSSGDELSIAQGKSSERQFSGLEQGLGQPFEKILFTSEEGCKKGVSFFQQSCSRMVMSNLCVLSERCFLGARIAVWMILKTSICIFTGNFGS